MGSGFSTDIKLFGQNDKEKQNIQRQQESWRQDKKKSKTFIQRGSSTQQTISSESTHDQKGPDQKLSQSDYQKKKRRKSFEEEKKNQDESTQIQIRPSPIIEVGQGFGYVATGLRNIGNTCFMNSILQCLFATAPLTQYFLTKSGYSKDAQQMKCLLSKDYFALIVKARKNEGSSVTPSELKDSVSRIARQFSGFGQQDAQEFLRCLLEGMHNELNRVKKKPEYQNINCEKYSMIEQSEVWYGYFRDRDDSIISDIFEGQLCSKIECQKCGYKSLSFDNFMDLSIPIPTSYKSLSLKDCLKNFIEPETMEKCGYKCEKCKAVDKMSKDITVFRFPQILVIHLKRFTRRDKLTNTIEIPVVLDMRNYAPHSNHESKDKAKNYKLYGMSKHSGSLNGGHYVGDVRDVDEDSWYACNDSQVQRYNGLPSLNSSSAYVLFYSLQ